MIKIKIDENLGLRGKEIFKTNGFDIRSVIDEDLCLSSDFNLIKICKEEKRCLVTLDLDFANPLIFKPSNYYGIAVFTRMCTVSICNSNSRVSAIYMLKYRSPR